MTIIPFIFKRYIHNTPIEYFWKDTQGASIMVASAEGAGSLG